MLVRHGETDWSRAERHTGRSDIPLTERGRRQAEQVGEWISSHSFARVLTSSLSRASETCALAWPGGCEPHDGLLEWDYGEYDGLTTAEIRELRPDWYLWRDGCPGGESPADVGARADRVLDELSDLDGDALLVAHGHFLRVLTARWLGLGPEDGALFWLDTATIDVLGYERETRVLRAWNVRGPLATAA